MLSRSSRSNHAHRTPVDAAAKRHRRLLVCLAPSVKNGRLMLIAKSLITGLLLLVFLSGPAMHFLSCADATVLHSSSATAEARDSSDSSYGSYLIIDQVALSDVQGGVTTPYTSREWTMQGATARNLSQGGAVVSTNATRIVVPAAGAQKTGGAGITQAVIPSFPAWVWALIPITVSVALAALLILRTIFTDDDEQAAPATARSRSDEGLAEERYKKRGARLIPIKGSDEPREGIDARRGSKGRSITRIHIDDGEPKDRVSEETEEGVGPGSKPRHR